MEIWFHHKSAEYHGGHKAYPAGGTFRKYENGQLFLNEKSLVFIKDEKREEKRIEIIIPFTSVAIGNYGISKENKRGVIGGGGIGIPVDNINMMVGGLFSYDGKVNCLSIPYIDEYGVLQKPVFGIPSFGGKEIKKWSHELYKRVLEVKRNTSALPLNGNSIAVTNSTDISISKENLQQILKLRLVKGEIAKEGYNEWV